MILPNARDALHRGQLFRLLIEISDTPILSRNLIFKGGTSAAMQSLLDRFSVDLDFDILPGVDKNLIKSELETIFQDLGLVIKNKSKVTVQYILKYQAPSETRDTIKLDVIDYASHVDKYSPAYLADIDRYLICQTVETMFAHKLVAITDRYDKHGTIAGRDIYDIHHFFINNYRYDALIIETRTGMSAVDYLHKLNSFVHEKVSQKVVDEDLNMLLPPSKYKVIRKSLKSEVLAMLKGELAIA